MEIFDLIQSNEFYSHKYNENNKCIKLIYRIFIYIKKTLTVLVISNVFFISTEKFYFLPLAHC